ncbi:Major facilitator superfamily domain [Phytophthora cactorum]|nr:Major facilitator superfamily domain [Phytophthora cactorum]
MLAILSVLSAVNQAICYSYAPISTSGGEVGASTSRGNSHHGLLISYIPTSFIGSWIMDQKSLAYGVVLGGLLQAAGASLRYFACFLDPVGVVRDSIWTTARVAGNAVHGKFTASFLCELVPSIHAGGSTSVALNANALGTALVYLTAPFLVHSRADIPSWNLYIALLAVDRAWLPYSSFGQPLNQNQSFLDNSKVHKYDWSQWWTAFSHTGFWRTIVAFSLAECIVNALSALLDEFLSVTTFSKTQIGFIGAAFIVSSLVGGQLVSQQVDKMRNHKTVALICLLLTAISIGAFQLVPKVKVQATLLSLLVLGAVLGPIQPIVLELGVECSYPTSEATVAALQQLCGNLLSAIAVPGLSALQRMHTDGYGSLKDFFVSPEVSWCSRPLQRLLCSAHCKYKRSAHETKIVLPCINDDQVCWIVLLSKHVYISTNDVQKRKGFAFFAETDVSNNDALWLDAELQRLAPCDAQDLGEERQRISSIRSTK